MFSVLTGLGNNQLFYQDTRDLVKFGGIKKRKREENSKKTKPKLKP
jgi:hypothetical protein